MSANGRTPWATIFLILVNVVVATLVTLDPDVVVDWSFVPSDPTLLGVLVSPFLQNNTLHLLGNLVFLAAVGPFVELGSGPKRTIGIYLLGGLAGLASHYALFLAAGVATPLLGSSAAIAACVGFCSIRYFSSAVPLAPKFNVPIYVVAFLWLALQVVGSFVTFGGGTTAIAYWSHIAGFLAGIVAALILKAQKAEIEGMKIQEGEELEHRGLGAKRAALEEHLRLSPTDFAAWGRLAVICNKMEDDQAEAAALAQVAKSDSPDKERIESVERLAELKRLSLIPGAMRLRMADQWARRGETVHAVLIESVIEDSDDAELHPDALLMLAELAPESVYASDALERLQREFPLSCAFEIARKRGMIK